MMAVPGRKAPKTSSFTWFTSLALSKTSSFTSPALSKGSEEEIKSFCEPCDRPGQRHASAGYCMDCEERLCQSCFSNHKNVKPCQNHTLLDNDALSEYKRLSSRSTVTSCHGDLNTPCPKHKKERIEFYCQDHDAILCSVCVVLGHTRDSCNVSNIPDVSRKIVNSQEYKDTVRSTDVLFNKCQDVKTEMKKTIADSNRSLTHAQRELKEHREEINKMFDDLEKEVEYTGNVFRQENDTRLKAMETICDDVYKSLKSSHDTVTQLNASKQAAKLFVELKLAQEVNKDNESSIKNLPGIGNITKFSFKPNKAIPEWLKNERSLGTIEPAERVECTNLPTASPKPTYHGDISVKTPEDKMRCQITGMVLLSSEQLVLADHSNESIKTVDVKNQEITCRETLSSEPWDICAVTDTELAVTLPFKQTVKFISVTSNRLTPTHSLKVAGQCRGISCHQHNLVVTYTNLGKLQIMNLKGAVLTTVRTNSIGEDLFHMPYYVEVNSRSIYVSDYKTGASTLMMFNWKGEITSKFEDLDEAEGIALTKDGTVFVCEWGKDRVRKILCDGTRGEVVLKDLQRPQAVCWREKGGILYISSPLDENYANFLKVYQIQ